MNYASQIAQDRWVESVLGPKRNGFFIELGACDGLYYSNTLHFERDLNWQGICIEPNDSYFLDLCKNRNCFISTDLIFSDSEKIVDFVVCRNLATSGILNENTGPFTTIEKIQKKNTTLLSQVLDNFNAPRIIDFLSLDVEGQEYAILSTFPFDKYRFRTLTVKHNAPHIGPVLQTKIRELLTANGYEYVKGNDDIRNWGHGPIDDFYIHPCALSEA
jgi:FkbM family methyltransferase